MSKLYFLFALVLLCCACKRESDLPPLSPDEFTAEQRELLGSRLAEAIQAYPDLFPIKRRQSESDQALYQYLQWLYEQASHFYHFDQQDAPKDIWDSNRLWELHIIESSSVNAFALPGGDFYITAGMLLSLQGVDQLFALLALELTRMQDRFLFYKYIEQFGTLSMLDYIERGDIGQADPLDFLNILSQASYDKEVVQMIDQRSLDHICQSSIFDPEALKDLELHFLQTQSDWIARKSYPGRAQQLLNILEASSADCGQRGDEGDYQRFVLDHL